jgi:hypothetical protein
MVVRKKAWADVTKHRKEINESFNAAILQYEACGDIGC